MADRFPLIANPSTNQIQEMPSGDQLDLTGNNIANAGIITATSFHGNGANITGITQLGTLSSLNVSGNASIGGVLTYEDVTNIDSVGIITARSGVNLSGLLKEKIKINATTINGNDTIDLEDGMVHYYTTQSSVSFVPKLRFNSTTTLDSKMSVGETITVTIIHDTGGNYPTDFQIDGVSIAENWVGGSAPTGGGSSGVDILTYNIIKTASATFTVIANLTKTSQIMLIYPTFKMAPIQGLTGFGGGATGYLVSGGAGGITQWSSSNFPPADSGDSNVQMDVVSGHPNILQIYYSTTVSLSSNSGTTNSGAQHSCVLNFDFTGYGITNVTFYGIGPGGGGNTGPCSNGSGGGGGAFKIVCPAGDSRLSSVTLRTGFRGRGGYQQSGRSFASGPPYGVADGAYAGGQTRVTFSNGTYIYANGGDAGVNDNCSSVGSGGGNGYGGTASFSGQVPGSVDTFSGGAGAYSGHSGNTGGNAAFPGGYISGSATAGGGGSSGYYTNISGYWGIGGKGCSITSNAGTTGANTSGSYNTPSENIIGCNLFSGDANGFGGGGGNIETDGSSSGGTGDYAGYAGHGGMGAIWIELT